MLLNKVEFRDSTQDKNGDIFEFIFEGIPKSDDIDKIKIQELIAKFMNKYHGDIITNIKFLRTIFRDYDEKLLVINYQNDKAKETIKFDNSHMSLFEKSEKNKDSNFDESLGVKFTTGNDTTNLIFTGSKNKEYRRIYYEDMKNVSEKIEKVLKEIYYLSDIEPINLDYDSKAIVEVYKLFYNENPNFSDENINIKIQTMVSILAKYNISIRDYDFSLWGKRKIPMSMSLSNQVYELFPLGEVKEIDDPIKIRKDVERTISIVGEEIRNVLKSTSNQQEVLINISKAIYAARYNLSSTANIENIAKYIDCTKDEVESSMRLVRKINARIYNNQE